MNSKINDELRAALERTEHRLSLARKKMAQFKHNEMESAIPLIAAV